MSYAVKEMFLTLQGEGVNAGARAVFVRFAGCNLWSGREQDRATAICKFCDTQFVGTDGLGGGKFADADALGDAVAGFWGAGSENRFVVLTGGEPMLQVDDALVEALHARGFRIAIESNGTLPVHPGIATLLLAAYPAQILRLAAREGFSRSAREAALHLTLAKFAEAQGAIGYHLARLRNRRMGLIEYK